MAHGLAGCSCGVVHCPDRRGLVGLIERHDERHERLAHPKLPACAARPSSLQLHDGDIRLLSGLEEAVATMRRGADELENWGRCADLDRIEKVRRLATLVGGVNQLLGAEVVAAVAALADIEGSPPDRPASQGAISTIGVT